MMSICKSSWDSLSDSTVGWMSTARTKDNILWKMDTSLEGTNVLKLGEGDISPCHNTNKQPSYNLKRTWCAHLSLWPLCPCRNLLISWWQKTTTWEDPCTIKTKPLMPHQQQMVHTDYFSFSWSQLTWYYRTDMTALPCRWNRFYHWRKDHPPACARRTPGTSIQPHPSIF